MQRISSSDWKQNETSPFRSKSTEAHPYSRLLPCKTTRPGLPTPVALGALVKTTRRWEGATSAVVEARQPFPQDERDALVRQVVEASKAAVHEATRKEAGRMVRTLDRRQVARLGLGMGGAFMLGGGLMLGGLVYLSAGPFNPTGQAAAAWRDLEQHNPDPGPALAAAEVRTDKATGRRFYAGVSLWLDPAGPAPAMRTKP